MKHYLPAIALIGLASCKALHRDDPELPIPVPDAFSSPNEDEANQEDAWWTSFGDLELNEAVHEALTHNYDLQASAHRVRAAAALADIAGADRLPSVGLNGQASRNKVVFTGIPGPGGGVLTNTASNYGVSLDVGWEVDLWGRLGARAQAAGADADAVAFDYEAARQSVAAQTAKAWFAWQGTRLQAELARSTVESFDQTNDVVLRRFRSGSGSAFDVRSSQAELAGARALLELRSEEVERVERQLELLLGRYPSGDVEAVVELPTVGTTPGAGLPSELLLRRPDLRAAELRLRSADHALYEARASLYPQLNLTGSVGRLGPEADDVFDPDFNVWSIAAGLFQPLYQGGRLRANVDFSEAGVQEALSIYASTVLTAFSEVETNLAVNDMLARQEGFEAGAVENAGEAYELALGRYSAGLDDIVSLLLAQRRSIEAQARLLNIRQRRLESRVDLYLALGGGFGEEENTAVREEESDERLEKS
jgi:NodT family efflux transporter outer membrane factor (OMF) lipoprotein